jgi:hypothetical protein
MRWTRVHCDAYQQINIPPVCPNCLAALPEGAGAGAGYGTPDAGQIIWPLCDRCSAIRRRGKRLTLSLAVLPALVVCALGAVAAMVLDWGEPWLWYGVGGAFALAILGFIVGGIVTALTPLTNGRITNFDAVRLNRAGPKAFSKDYFLDISFLNAGYVEELIAANPHLDMRVS